MTSRQKFRQRDRLLDLLKRRHLQWIPLPDILALGIAQYNARIYELRRIGYGIENKQEGDHSWFRLVTTLAPAAIPKSCGINSMMVHERPHSTTPMQTPETAGAKWLFAEVAPERHRDDG
jgi:hypothetical protein